MIDTVCLTLPRRHIILLDENNDKIPNWDLYSRTETYAKYVRNPSFAERNTGQYFPRITAYSRKCQSEQQIKIEFSAPKLIYRNNLEELSDDQFEDVIKELQDRLKRMGVSIFKKMLMEAPVTSVHYGRNFILKDGQTATNVIAQLGKIDLRKSFDFAKARYINDGQSLCCHTSAHELIFYDKIADLLKNKKRAIDRDQTKHQMSLFETVRSRDHPYEVLRMEVRLSQKQKLNSIFKKLQLPINPKFRDVFSSSISKKVLNEYWNEIVRSRNYGALMLESSPIETLKRIEAEFPTIKPKQLIGYTGLLLLAQSGNGLRELRSVLEKKSSDRTWARIASEYRQISERVAQGRIRNWVKEIDQQLDIYSPLRINQ